MIIISSFLIFSNIVLHAQENDSLEIHVDTSNYFIMGLADEILDMPNAIVSPNPLQGPMIQVHFDKYVSDGLAVIYITNLNGELAYSGQIMINNNTAYIDLFDKHLSRGYYSITLIRGNQKVTGKFIVEE